VVLSPGEVSALPAQLDGVRGLMAGIRDSAEQPRVSYRQQVQPATF